MHMLFSLFSLQVVRVMIDDRRHAESNCNVRLEWLMDDKYNIGSRRIAVAIKS